MKNASEIFKDLPDGSGFLDGSVLDGPEPKVEDTVYIVLAFRYGRDGYAFPIGVFSTHTAAENAAKEHRDFRGGKYAHRIYEFSIDKWDDDIGHKGNNHPCIEVDKSRL
jgi:hypothetical protein